MLVTGDDEGTPYFESLDAWFCGALSRYTVSLYPGFIGVAFFVSVLSVNE